MSICPSHFHLIVADSVGLLKGPDTLFIQVHHPLEMDLNARVHQSLLKMNPKTLLLKGDSTDFTHRDLTRHR